jgi:hypothetical protein
MTVTKIKLTRAVVDSRKRHGVKNADQSDLVRFAAGPATRRAYEQLANLELEFRDSGMVYNCPVGLHDDLGMSCAMLAWAAQHPHLPAWMRELEAARRPRRPRQTHGWGAFV